MTSKLGSAHRRSTSWLQRATSAAHTDKNHFCQPKNSSSNPVSTYWPMLHIAAREEKKNAPPRRLFLFLRTGAGASAPPNRPLTERTGKRRQGEAALAVPWHSRPPGKGSAGRCRTRKALDVPRVAAALTAVSRGIPRRGRDGTRRSAAWRHHHRRTV
jgi:hypothetical protein